MSIQTEWIQYGAGKYSGFAARQEGVKEPLPAVIVIQEIWGVDPHIQDVTVRLAQAGYAAFAPDLFARGGKREEGLEAERVEAAKAFLNTIPPGAWRNTEERTAALAKLPEEQQKSLAQTLEKVFGLAGKWGEYVEQLAATSAFLREEYAPSQGKGVASVGFCMGGGLTAVLAAQDSSLKAAVIYYGSSPNDETIERIQCPVLGLYGELDTRITDTIPAFADSMKAKGKSFDYYIYPNAPHAFFNDTRPSYHVSSARDAFVRTLQFLNENLGS